jgi:aquaporin Z
MNKYITEFIGTFFLVLTIGCTVLAGSSGVIPPMAIGAALMVMVYAGGHLSGAHYNPAVTIGVWLRGRCKAADVAPYIAAQAVGAVLAALAVSFLRPDAVINATPPNLARALVAETLYTFALVYVVLNVATSKKTQGNSYFGLAIGFTVLSGAFAVGDISGGAFNPAVRLGVTVMGLSSWSNLGTLVIANFAGAVAAGLTFKLLNPDDK